MIAKRIPRLPAVSANPSWSFKTLQRKCACGGSSGLTGSCSECEKKKLLGQPLQTKLRINEPGDQYEKEADCVAEQVMGMTERDFKPGDLQSGAMIQRRVVPGAPKRMDAAPLVNDVLASSGQPLDAATREFFSARLGHEFGHVRVHADAGAAESARAVNALAYTMGPDVVFAAGQYAPRTRAGQRLLAHELTHVMQQSGGSTIPTDAILSRRAGITGSAPTTGLLQREPAETTGSCDDMVFCTHLNLPFPMKDRYFVDGDETDESKHNAGIADEMAKGRCNISLTQEVGVNLGPLNPSVTVNFFYRGEPCCKCFKGTLSWDVMVSGIPQPHQVGSQRVDAGDECSAEECCQVKKSLPISLDISLGAKFHVDGTIQLNGSTYKQTS